MAEIPLHTPGVKAVRLDVSHFNGILDLMNREGWYYYDPHELNRYLKLDQACFTLLKGNRVAGSIFTTNYGNQAWIGNIVVAESLRGKGIAGRMIQGVINHLQSTQQIRTFRLGSVPLAIGLYKKAGFRPEAFTTAQEAELPLKIQPESIDLGETTRVEQMKPADLDAVAKLDAQFFNSSRLALLTELHKDSIPETCLCLKDRETMAGFLMIRRRQASKTEAGFAEGPEYAYRLGPSCVLPQYGIQGFKALFQEAIQQVNQEVSQSDGSARIYAVFPRNAEKTEIFRDTRELAKLMEMDAHMDLDRVFDAHNHIFGAPKCPKNQAQWDYMASIGFHQEYFEQVMCHTSGSTGSTTADPEGIFATATPGDKA